MQSDKEIIEKFLEELSELSVKHKVFIWGCGCCGSPNLLTGQEIPSYEIDLNGKYIQDDGYVGQLQWKNNAD